MTNFHIVGYMPHWEGEVLDGQLEKVTHVNYAFLLPNDAGDGTLQPIENPVKLSTLVARGHERGVKVLISVGGDNGGNDQGFEKLTGSPDAVQTFINNIVELIGAFNLDGVDIDWEYPNPGSSAQNYANLMKLLNATMRRAGKMLTAAVIACGDEFGEGILTEVFDYVDYLTLMAYDSQDTPSHSPYEYAVSSLDYWLGRGLPASKAVLGVPFYGREPYAAYNKLVENDPQAPFKDITNYNGQMIRYNGIETIKRKTHLALERCSGIMFWEMSQDVTNGDSLLQAIYETVYTERKRT